MAEAVPTLKELNREVNELSGVIGRFARLPNAHPDKVAAAHNLFLARARYHLAKMIDGSEVVFTNEDAESLCAILASRVWTVHS